MIFDMWLKENSKSLHELKESFEQQVCSSDSVPVRHLGCRWAWDKRWGSVRPVGGPCCGGLGQGLVLLLSRVPWSLTLDWMGNLGKQVTRNQTTVRPPCATSDDSPHTLERPVVSLWCAAGKPSGGQASSPALGWLRVLGSTEIINPGIRTGLNEMSDTVGRTSIQCSIQTNLIMFPIPE